MGRTNPTFRDLLGRIEETWGEFRRVLRHRDRPRFDRLWTYARQHADAAGMLNHDDPLEAILLSIDLEQESRLDELDERIERLEDRLEDRAAESGDAVQD